VVDGVTEQKDWESTCCRCEGEAQKPVMPGKRACHITCGACTYPEDWNKCASCEIVGHCALALEHLKSLKAPEVEKGCHFKQQLTGEENLYQTLSFVNGQQQRLQESGEKVYIKTLKQANAKSSCLRRVTKK
jgi:hypothetical protein